MAKTARSNKNILNDTHRKGTSIGRGKIKFSTMNKHKKRSFKKYRGQGR